MNTPHHPISVSPSTRCLADFPFRLEWRPARGFLSQVLCWHHRGTGLSNGIKIQPSALVRLNAKAPAPSVVFPVLLRNSKHLVGKLAAILSPASTSFLKTPQWGFSLDIGYLGPALMGHCRRSTLYPIPCSCHSGVGRKKRSTLSMRGAFPRNTDE
jgi:hypothetical protein